MASKLIVSAFILLLSLGFSCTPSVKENPQEQKSLQSSPSESDPLPSWREGKTKQAIMDYVASVTDPNSPHFIPVPDRIATFDNDGNLWAEKPLYFQLIFAMDKLKSLADQHPEWKKDPVMKAAIDHDTDALFKYGEKGLMKIVLASHANTTGEEFEQEVLQWIKTARHPSLKRPYTELIYQPMVELVHFLQKHKFKTFIVSGGGLAFMRPWVEEVYGIPRDQVVGSTIKIKYDDHGGQPVIRRLPELEFIDDKAGKPEAIYKFIGRKPVFASGNSDGDLQMLRWAASGTHQSFMLLLHHTDTEREWAYDRESAVGRLNLGLTEAPMKNWTITDMKKDWKIIFPPSDSK